MINAVALSSSQAERKGTGRRHRSDNAVEEQNVANSLAEIGSTGGTEEGVKEKNLTFAEVQSELKCSVTFYYFFFEECGSFQVFGLKRNFRTIKA